MMYVYTFLPFTLLPLPHPRPQWGKTLVDNADEVRDLQTRLEQLEVRVLYMQKSASYIYNWDSLSFPFLNRVVLTHCVKARIWL